VTAASLVILALLVGLGGTLWFAVENAEIARQARQSRNEATALADDVLSLSDGYDLDVLKREAEILWPASSAMIPALEKWLQRAKELGAKIGQHRANLSKLETAADSTENLWWRERLDTLVRDLELFAGETIPSVEKRRNMARSVREKTIESPLAKKRWKEAIASIRNKHESSVYKGLEIQPQEGLIPIGRDLKYGLWELCACRDRRSTRA
jgi:hypothetical protein